jgi:hypothetical protein
VIAGGVGLNIQAASVVILCEPQLKTSTKNQAIAKRTAWVSSSPCRSIGF